MVFEIKTVHRITRQFHADGKKRRSFLTMLFAAGELQRSVHDKKY